MLFRLFSRYWPFFLLMVAGSFLFEWWLLLLQGLLCLSLWPFLFSKKPSGDAEAVEKNWVFFLLLFLFFLGARLWPFLLAEHPLGYDTGIYRFEIWSSLQALPEYVSGLFLGLPLVTDVAFLFGWSLDQILYGGYLIVNLLFFVSLWMFVEKWGGKKKALWALFFLVISVVQWKAFSMLLYKQVFAMALVMMSFWLLMRRSYLVIPVLLYLALLQPLDAFLIALSLLLFLPWAWKKKLPEARYFSCLALAGLFSLLLFFLLDAGFWADAWQLFRGSFVDGALETHQQEGIFLSLADYGVQAAFVFVLGVLGWVMSLRKEGFTLFHQYSLLLLIWVSMRFFFFERLLIQLDMVLMVFAAFSMDRFMSHFVQDRSSRWISVLMLVTLSIPLLVLFSSYKPFISVPVQTEITELCDSLDADVTIGVGESASTPIVRGLCLDQIVFGPGLYANRWDFEDWQIFWEKGTNAEIQDILNEYARPLYFFSTKKQLQKRFVPELFERVGEGWYRVR